MLRLIRYLKPYWLLILLAIGLLFLQAMADLALPNYMSRIVNVGIQQGGIESAVPAAMRQSQMEKALLFMSGPEKEQVLQNYTLVSSASVNAAELAQSYPLLQSEALYILNDVDESTRRALNPILGKAVTVVYSIQQAVEDPAKAVQFGAQFGFDLSAISAGGDVFSLLTQMPQVQMQQMNAAIHEKFAAMDESMLTQSAANAIQAEYNALGMDTAELRTAFIVQIGLQMLMITLVSAVATILVGLLSARAAAGVARDLRQDIFRKVEGFSKAELEKFSTASLITRSTNDISQIQFVLVMVIRMVFFAPIIGVGAVIRAVDTSPSMTWIIGLGVAILLVMIIVVFMIALPRFQRIQKLVDRLNLVTRELLSGLMVVRAFNAQNFELKRFDNANQELTDNNLFVSRVMVTMMPLMMFLMNGLSVLIIWVGAHQVAQSSLQVGDMMAFLQYSMQVVFSFLMLSMMFIFLPRAAVSGERVAEVLEVVPGITDPLNPREFDQRSRGLVEFRNVSFRYPDAEENVLCGISFSAKPGETTAIIGSTGSGKSTVVNLIPRFFDVTEGAVYVDGVDIREVKQSDLRERIGYIPQRGMLFSGTVESNLRFADENAAPEKLAKAIEIAQASEFIQSNPDGLAAEISQGGDNVSGGQKQRLAIARALVKQPPIYIFDDCLSALDYKTDLALRKAIKKETGESTMIIVTQRIATIKNAEQIIVLNDGQIAGKGTHKALMKSCETYREIAYSQLSEKELAQ